MNNKNNSGLNYDTKTLIVVILLLLAYPIGVILMFKWMKWPSWLLYILSIPLVLIVLAILGIMTTGMLVSINPMKQINKAGDSFMKNNAVEVLNGVERYYAVNNVYPWGNINNYKSKDITGEVWFSKLDNAAKLKKYWESRPITEKINTNNLSLTQNQGEIKVCFQSKMDLSTICVPEN
jgi:hypothetical protein